MCLKRIWPLGLTFTKDLERWITQKRAELARDKADLGTSNKENEPLATLQTDAAIAAPAAAAGVAPEALLFKLGDDYQVRKARYNEELKTQFEQTQIEKDALQRKGAINRFNSRVLA